MGCARLYQRHLQTTVLEALHSLRESIPTRLGLYLGDLRSQAPDAWFRRLQHLFNRANSRQLLRRVRDFAPDLVICTHYLPLELLSFMKATGALRAPVFGVITDISPHSFRILPNIDHYFAATQASARELELKGCPASRITVSGIPVDPIFKLRREQRAMRERHELPVHLSTVLTMSGGFGLGPLTQITQSFAQSNRPISLVVITGRSQALKQTCEKIVRRSRLAARIYGYVDCVEELIDAADIVITKPGGLSSSEILVKQKPMVLVAPIPGQEQRNCEYLLEHGAAVRLYNYRDAAFFVESLLADKKKLAAMRRAAQQIAFPEASQTIATMALKTLALDAFGAKMPELNAQFNCEPQLQEKPART